MNANPHPLRLTSYRPGNPPPPKPPRPTLTKRAHSPLDGRAAERQRQAVRAGEFRGFCWGIVTGFSVLLWVTAMHCAGKGGC